MQTKNPYCFFALPNNGHKTLIIVANIFNYEIIVTIEMPPCYPDIGKENWNAFSALG